MTDGYWTVVLGLLGWALLFGVLIRMNRKETETDLKSAMDKARRQGRPPPGEVGDPAKICRKYEPGGPSPCEWPFCTCTKGMKRLDKSEPRVL